MTRLFTRAGVNLINVLMHRFYMPRSQKRKKTVKSSVILRFWDLYTQNLLVKWWWKRLLGSISSMFYDQPLCLQILKAQKKTVKVSIFFALLGSVCSKAVHKIMMKLTPGHLPDFGRKKSTWGSLTNNHRFFTV